MSEQIKRYIPGDYHMLPAPDGSFVTYSDHAAALSARDAEIERLQGELAAQKRLHMDAWSKYTTTEAQVRELQAAIEKFIAIAPKYVRMEIDEGVKELRAALAPAPEATP